MATILTKKSDTSSSVPLAADLTNAAGGAELAVNTADKRLYSKTSGGSVVELGTNPSALSLPNGTANGVPYLNGSKVLTSGSALTFDGTTLNVGIGGVGKIQVGTASSGTYQTGFYGSNGVDTDFQIRFKTGITEVGTSTATPLAFALSGSEQMRLTSTGLGIGTSSPGAKLHVKVGTNQNIFFDSSSGVTRITAVNDAVNDNVDLLIQGETLRFNTDGTERMRLDSSGNLGLGVTPSAWSGGYKALQVNDAAFASYASGYTWVGSNWYNNGSGNKYIGNGYATLYEQNSGNHTWSTAPSGTAGNAISFTQAMTLDASGNLLVGTTSSATYGNGVKLSGSADAYASLGHSSGTTSGSGYVLFGYGGTGIGSITQNGTTGVLYNLTSDYRLKNNPTALNGSGEFIDALQPKSWDWWDGSGKGVGFIAHEFMEVAKYSGTGTKDAVDKDGKPVYQSIQPSSSEVMANLVAEIQSLRKRLAALESK